MRFKDDTIRLTDLQPQIVLAITMIEPIIKEHCSERMSYGGFDPFVITSVNDGRHSEKSLHYKGRAIDIRIWHMKDPLQCAADMAEALGPEFDVVLEETHIHLEYDPK